MTTPLVTDFKCLAGIYEEQPDSSFALITRMADLTEIFHPLQDGSTKVAPTGFLVKMNDGTIKDLNEVFEPLSSGKQCELPTNFEVDGTDLRDIFAGLNTVQVQLELSQLPAGVFDCTTRVKIHYDRSGSMETAFEYITPAIEVLKEWFNKTFNFGKAGYGSIVVENPAEPWEQTLTWISEDAGATSSQTEVHIAYINESLPSGTGFAGGYVDKWIAAQQAGGHRYAAIMGCPPLYGGYDAVILGDITRDQKNGRTLAEMGVSAFFDIQQTAPSSSHIEIISNWLNVPTKPEDLTITVSALESDQYDDRVRWNVSSGICGLTQKANGAGILQSQSSWKHEVYVGESQDLIHTENFTSLQTSYTYMADDHKGETDFYLKVTAVGDNGETDKSSSLVLCNKQKRNAETDFDAPLEPQYPAPGARAHFSGGLLITHDAHSSGMERIFMDGKYGEFVGLGDYPSNATTFPNSIRHTFDAIAVDAGVRCIIYSSKNFTGSVLFDRTGPFVLWNGKWEGSYSWSDWRDGVSVPQGHPSVKYEDIFPPEVRLFSTSDMHQWKDGSMKLRKVS